MRRPSRARSRDQSKRPPKNTGRPWERKNTEPEYEDEIPGPWVPTTPARKLGTLAIPDKTEKPGKANEELQEQYQQVLRIKESLTVAKLEIPTEVQTAIQGLEEALMPRAPRITHKTVSQVTKWTARVNKLRAQITEMDDCYEKFQKHLASIHKEQSEAYKELRDRTVKQKETMDEMKAASNSFEEPNTEVPEPPVPSDQPWAITESEEEEPMETTEKKKRGLSRDALRPFGKRNKAEEKEQEAEL